MTKELSLEAWTKRITKKEMPVLEHTIRDIQKIARDDRASLSTVSEIILHDPSMTARVLRLANSVYFTPTGSRLNTISRAVMVLGFDRICDICLTLSVVNELLPKKPRARLITEMSRSFHAAVQARELGALIELQALEEVFVAALLYRVGEMAFWCFGEETADALELALNDSCLPPAQIERKILGFQLSKLSLRLSEEWGLSELLQSALRKSGSQDIRSELIVATHDFARCVEQSWDSEETKLTIRKIQELSGLPGESLRPKLLENARNAVHVARRYGAALAASAIPLPDKTEHTSSVPTEDLNWKYDLPPFYEPDLALQLKILQELSDMLDRDTEMETVLKITLEGIYRGVGMDRTLCALISEDTKRLSAESTLGNDRLFLAKYFDFEQSPIHANIFFQVLADQQAFWITEEHSPEIKLLLPRSIVQVIGQGSFFVAPIVSHGRSLGVFYADRRPSERPLKSEDFDSFRHFVQSSNLSLEHIRKA